MISSWELYPLTWPPCSFLGPQNGMEGGCQGFTGTERGGGCRGPPPSEQRGWSRVPPPLLELLWGNNEKKKLRRRAPRKKITPKLRNKCEKSENQFWLPPRRFWVDFDQTKPYQFLFPHCQRQVHAKLFGVQFHSIYQIGSWNFMEFEEISRYLHHVFPNLEKAQKKQDSLCGYEKNLGKRFLHKNGWNSMTLHRLRNCIAYEITSPILMKYHGIWDEISQRNFISILEWKQKQNILFGWKKMVFVSFVFEMKDRQEGGKWIIRQTSRWRIHTFWGRFVPQLFWGQIWN